MHTTALFPFQHLSVGQHTRLIALEMSNIRHSYAAGAFREDIGWGW